MKRTLFKGLAVGVEFMNYNKSVLSLSSEAVKVLSGDISIDQGVLAFKDLKSYEFFISIEDSSIISVALDQLYELGFKSYHSISEDIFKNKCAINDEGLDSEYLNADDYNNEELDGFIDYFLNKDGVILIKDYLFKVVISEHTIYALQFDNTKDIYDDALLKIQQKDKNVFVFSMEDDIFGTLSLVDNDSFIKARKICSRNVSNTKDWYDYFDNNKTRRKRLRYRCRLRLNYLNIGIYKSLTTKFEHQRKKGGGAWTNDFNSFSIGYDVSWMNNPGGQTGQVHHNPTNLEYYSKNKKIKLYGGAKCLRIFDLVSHSMFLNKGNPEQVLFINPDEDHHITQVY